MRKTVIILIVLVLISTIAFYYNWSETNKSSRNEKNAQYLLYTSIYPIYEVATKIAGNKGEIGLVVPNGTEAHSYEPPPRKIAELESADIFFYIGIGMEPWADKAALILGESDVKSIELSNYLDLINYKRDTEEGIDHDHNHALDHEYEDEIDDEHNHENVIESDQHHDDEIAGVQKHQNEVEFVNGNNHGDSEHGSYDPHVWLDPMNMKKIAEIIKDELVSLDPVNKDLYISNYNSFSSEISELDEEYKQHLSDKSSDTIIVSHAAFGYLARRYNFKQRAIAGLTSHEESTPGNIASLIDFARDNNINYVFRETLVDNHAVRVIAEEAELRVLTLNPFVGLTQEEQEEGEDYFSIMKKNLRNLEKALVK
ncbi:MAG: metal ABC transporter solute-binding protein, Zn/Mn family [Halanaerobiales bacterium]